MYSRSYWDYGIALVTSLIAFRLYKQFIRLTRKDRSNVIRSPRHDLSSHTDAARLPYPLDIYPGGRCVETPYGSTQVYEWGPEGGEKVLFIHGISTPAIALGQLAQELVDRGCRVMIFDLFGRGLSDTPSDLLHDVRLYTTQILLVISSSTLPWTINSGFHLIGYSMGGGIAMAVTRHLPHLVQSLTLIAPSGLMRSNQIGWKSYFLYSLTFLPNPIVHYFVRRRLQPLMRSKSAKGSTIQGVEYYAKAEVRNVQADKDSGNSDASGGNAYDEAKLLKNHAYLTTAWIVSWQLQHHPGFIPSFISCIRNAPIYNQDADWAVVGARLAEQKLHPTDVHRKRRGLHGNKVLFIFGDSDPVIVKEQTIRDAKILLGRSHAEIVALDAGHEVPITRAPEVAEVVWKFWKKTR